LLHNNTSLKIIMEITFQLKHGNSKYELATRTDVTLVDLMVQIEELSGVPVSGQKLIVNGRSLTSLDQSKSLSDCRISPGCKVMLLGKKHDPTKDQLYQSLMEIEQKTIQNHNQLIQLMKEVEDVEKGFLAANFEEERLKGLLKSCRCCSEGFMRSLESLDAMRFEDNQFLAKNKRKSLATDTNKSLDAADDVIKRIEQRLENSRRK